MGDVGSEGLLQATPAAEVYAALAAEACVVEAEAHAGLARVLWRQSGPGGRHTTAQHYTLDAVRPPHSGGPKRHTEAEEQEQEQEEKEEEVEEEVEVVCEEAGTAVEEGKGARAVHWGSGREARVREAGEGQWALEVLQGGRCLAHLDLRRRSGQWLDVVCTARRPLQWSPCGTRVLLLAEAPAPHHLHHRQEEDGQEEHGQEAHQEEHQEEHGEKHGEEEEEAIVWERASEARGARGPSQWEWEEDWGERWRERRTGELWAAQVEEGPLAMRLRLRQLPLPAHLSADDATWAPDSAGVVAVARARHGMRMGMHSCRNRAAGLYLVPWRPGPARLVTANVAEDFAAWSPSFSPDGRRLAWLSSSGLTHNSCHRLRVRQWPLAAGLPPATVVDVVEEAAAGAFPGLYCAGLAARPWLGARTLLLSSAWRSGAALLAVDVESGAVRRLPAPRGLPHVRLLDVSPASACRAPAVVACASAPLEPWAAFACAAADGALGPWAALGRRRTPPLLARALAQCSWAVQEVATRDGAAVEALWLAPPPQPPLPLALLPHGGPHSGWRGEWDAAAALLVLRGRHVALLNYRGGLGFGAAPLRSLAGQCGTRDVADLLDTARAFADKAEVDGARMAVVGGSHGGFLAGHAVGQAPGLFRAAVLRNPVTNIASMLGATDIPDWTVACALGVGAFPHPHGRPGPDGVWLGVEDMPWPGAAAASAMRAASPIAHVEAVQAPVLFLVGGSDARVPPSQARELFLALRARRATTAMRRYPSEGHAITGAQEAADAWAAADAWLTAHL